MAKTPGLVRKKSAYFYVRRIPADIAALFGNRQQLTIPLNTTDYRIASERARAKAAEVDKQFQDARLGISTAADRENKASRHQLEQAVRVYLFEAERDAESSPVSVSDRDYLNEWLEILESPYDVWAGDLHKKALDIASRFRLKIKPGDHHWLEFIGLVHRAEVEHCRRSLDRIAHIFSVAGHDRLFAEVFATNLAPKLVGNKGLTVDELITRFESDPLRAGLTESAGRKYIVPFAAIREVAGREFPVREIDRAMCADMIETIAALPPNYRKDKSLNGKSLREVGEINGKRGGIKLVRGTVEVYAHHLSAFFNYAIDKGVIETNPATRLMASGNSQPAQRFPFDTDELKRLIASLPQWSEGSRGRFWLPLIALFSGMRLGEIIWLRYCDIRQVDGVTCFVLEPTDDRSLKTRGSARVVPVHPRLVEFGLLDAVQRDGDQQRRIFADLPGEDQRHAVDLFQKRFSYWLKTDVKVRKGTSYHSYRHNFRDALRHAGVPIDVTRALGGWGRGSGIEDRYGQGTRASVLAEWMGKVGYPDVDFSPLVKV
ncbi:site-specific integrase [Ensifer sp.]|uniref:site-specific integrase n=1 Tax=Ensifer sp. TaxID=1872086 RepID=UPI00289DBA49|nr:site-specific integrase [Ensifer sp.]